MKILYSKKKRKYELFRCISNFLMFLMVLYYDMDNLFFLLLFFCLSLLSFYLFIKTKRTNYLIIEKGVLKQNYIFGKKIELSDIKSIKHFAGEYILRTEKRKMTITIDVIDKSSLLDLTTELKKLDVKWI